MEQGWLFTCDENGRERRFLVGHQDEETARGIVRSDHPEITDLNFVSAVSVPWSLIQLGNAEGRAKEWSPYAVAVRDGEELYLLIIVNREGDNVYVNSLRPAVPEWNPHASYHASGQHHVKSFNHRSFVRCRQRPDQNFRGIAAVEHLVIGPSNHRAINWPCRLSDFHDVFEIAQCDLPKAGRLCVDLAEPGAAPGMPFLGAKIVRQASFKDRVPWILVTLWS